MSTLAPTARIHLIPALRAPRVVVIRRKPSKTFHVIVWNTKTDELEFGSWFHGRLYEDRCDVSPDGMLMSYLAMGDKGNVWNGVCAPPTLKTFAEWDNKGTWGGGGWWTKDGELIVCGSDSIRYPDGVKRRALSIRRLDIADELGGSPLLHRLMRDGWRRDGPMPKWERNDSSGMPVLQEDSGWYSYSDASPMPLRMSLRGCNGGYSYEFKLDQLPALLDSNVTWAAWDCVGQLLVARSGKLERYTCDGLAAGKPDALLDLEHLVAPWNRPIQHGAGARIR